LQLAAHCILLFDLFGTKELKTEEWKKPIETRLMCIGKTDERKNVGNSSKRGLE
jgi:hypothetical protein